MAFIPRLLSHFDKRRPRVLRPILWFALAALFLPLSSPAAPRLRCELAQGGDTRVLEFSPVTDPYSVKPVDINRRFRFKAVMVGSEEKLDYISLYVYYLSSGSPVLLYQAKFLSPLPRQGAEPNALTGLHYAYSPVLGRELRYGCTLAEVAP